MKSFKQLRQEVTQESYLQKEIFQEGNIIMNVNTGEKGRIIRSGVNYVIAVTESQKMFRAWVKDIRAINIDENINKERKNSSIFTNGKTESHD
jgi:N-methylhydantoinase B/oxoprolinase/acetone carboxylase alpha subunit